MPAQLSFDPARTAVLSMDLQAGIVSIYVKDQGRLFPAQAQILAANEFLGHLDSLTSSQCSAAMSLRTASASPITPFL
jgi:hypothetical protein